MAAAFSAKVLIEHRTDPAISGAATIETFQLSTSERLSGALTALGVCWAGGFLFVVIPVFHFVLVPLAAILGVGLFIAKLRFRERRSESTIVCPKCRQSVTLKAGAFSWPIRETCNNCRSALRISRAGG